MSSGAPGRAGESDSEGGEGEPALDLRVEAAEWGRIIPRIDGLAQRAAEAAILASGLRADQAALSLLLADDLALAALNAAHRGRDGATNVLSWPAFSLSEPLQDLGDLPASPDLSGRVFLGDVALALETARREAESSGKSLEEHSAHLIVHGVLHLLGHDHQDDEEAALMEAREVAALASIGVADPYETS